MTDLQAIQQRVSRRSYTGPLSPEGADGLSALASELVEQTGLAIRVERDAAALFGGFSKSYGMFSGVQSLVALAGDKEDPHLYEKTGHAGEKLVLEATKLGLGTCWVGGTFDRAAVATLFEPGATVVAVITVGPVAAKTGKEAFLYRMIHLGKRTKPETTPGAPAWYAAGCEAAALAPSAVNRHPVRFAWENGNAVALVPDAQTHTLIDLGIAKLHFELAAAGGFPLGNGAVFQKG